MTRLGDYEVHHFANSFPLIEGEEFDALVEDIQKNGLAVPVTITHDHQVLVDGRNRYRACLKLGIPPKLHVLGHHYTEEQILNLIVSENVHRRHLNAGQLAIVAMSYEKAIAEFKKELEASRKMETSVLPPSRTNGTATVAGPRPSSRESKSAEQAAKLVGASGRYVSQAKAIQRDAPDLLDSVRSGEKSLEWAEKERKQRVQQQKEESSPSIVEPPKKNIEEEKLKKKESDRQLREQREMLEDWTKKLEGQAEALKMAVFRGPLHPNLTVEERQQYAQTLRTAKTKISNMINKLEG